MIPQEKNKLKRYVPYLITLIAFIFYLLTLPSVIKLLIPCLSRLPGQSYSHEECVITFALDRFMVLSLIGFAIAILGLFLLVYPRSLKLLGLTGFILAVCIIFAYLQYIPESERQIKRAPIYFNENTLP